MLYVRLQIKVTNRTDEYTTNYELIWGCHLTNMIDLYAEEHPARTTGRKSWSFLSVLLSFWFTCSSLLTFGLLMLLLNFLNLLGGVSRICSSIFFEFLDLCLVGRKIG